MVNDILNVVNFLLYRIYVVRYFGKLSKRVEIEIRYEDFYLLVKREISQTKYIVSYRL